MTSSELIARAHAAQAERDGLRVKVRLPRSLKTRAENCAAACADDLAEWSAKACRRLLRVPTERTAPKVTRDDSTPVWLRAPAGMPPARIRLALLLAVEHAEPLLRPPPVNNLLPPGAVAGRDFHIETERE